MRNDLSPAVDPLMTNRLMTSWTVSSVHQKSVLVDLFNSEGNKPEYVLKSQLNHNVDCFHNISLPFIAFAEVLLMTPDIRFLSLMYLASDKSCSCSQLLISLSAVI